MPLVKTGDESLKRAAALISRGELVAFPTETVYGLGGDAFNPLALARIFEVKGRPRFDPLIIHIAAITELETVANLSLLDTAARRRLSALIEQFWPGPLTFILPKQEAIPALATSGLPNVAVRLPAHETARRLIALSTGAVAAPSANPFGYLSPTRAEHVAHSLGEKIAMILDDGPAAYGLESTVLDISGEQPCILRPGGVPKEAIEAVIGPLAGSVINENNPVSPGLLPGHYAPRAPLAAHDRESIMREKASDGTAFLFFDNASRDQWLSAQTEHGAITIAVLSETGNTREAAARLFDFLHNLDRPEITRIHAQQAPPDALGHGLGAAINDRLRRAAYAHTGARI